MLYYLRNQEAADTLEGLARWRLQEERVFRTTRDVKRALDWLVSQGFLDAQAHGARTLFRLNKSRVEDSAKMFGEQHHTNSGDSGTS